jgi:radical SAM superfamily enzyme YgiQ (UPF0313 family)
MRVLLVVYDNDAYIHFFPQGIAYLASALREAGCDVSIYNQDVHHYPDAALTAYLDANRFDMVGIGVIAGYYQYRKLLSLAEAVNRSKNRPFFVLGGHGPAPEPDFFLQKTQADAIVIGEGERTIVALVDAVARKAPLGAVEGIAFREGTRCVVNKRRELIQDIDTISWPAYDLFPIEYYRLLRMPHCEASDFALPMLSGRGCTFKCNFCYRMDKGFRPRSTQAIIEEIRFLKTEYRINYIAFSDELLMSSVARTEDICNGLIKSGVNIKWDCNGRLNYAKPDLLGLMRQAGCLFINYGIEAFDDRILKNMHKGLTTRQIERGVEATLAAGISPGLNIIFGNIGENRETLRKGMEFLLKYDDGAQLRTIRPVTGYPGTELYSYAIEHGLLDGIEDFYENKHINSDLLSVNYTELTDEEFHEALYEANRILIENYYQKKRVSSLQQIHHLYHERDAKFRGFRHT